MNNKTNEIVVIETNVLGRVPSEKNNIFLLSNGLMMYGNDKSQTDYLLKKLTNREPVSYWTRKDASTGKTYHNLIITDAAEASEMGYNERPKAATQTAAQAEREV